MYVGWSRENWLKEMRSKRIDDKLIKEMIIDQVPKYPPETPLIEVAEGLVHHYAVIVGEEMKTKVGIITRADFLKLFYEAFQMESMGFIH